MHIATYIEVNRSLIPALRNFVKALYTKKKEFSSIIKIGRTHCQDAVPITLGQEFSGYETQIMHGMRRISDKTKYINKLAQGGTAVGTGLNTFKGFAEQVAEEISKQSGLVF